MKEYVKSFFVRGLMFGGFGPIIAGIVYLMLSFTLDNFSLSGGEVFLSIVSVYILAFVQAGASIFNQIDSWPIAKSSLIHFCVIYVAYITCYLVNTWIPFDWAVILIFTAIFAVTYFIIWLTVFLIIRSTSKRINERLI